MVADIHSLIKTLHSIVEDTGEEQVEKDWCQGTALLHPTGDLKRIGLIAIWEDMSSYANTEGPDDLDEIVWAAVPCHYILEGLSVDLGQVDEYRIQIQVLLYAFLFNLSQWENHVNQTAPCVKSTLGFW